MKSIALVLCLVCALSAGTPISFAADEASTTPAGQPDWKQLYEDQKKRNDVLERRVSLLEDHNTQDLYVVKENVPEGTLRFLKETEISGFVSSSFTYNFNRPGDDINAGRLYDFNADQFMFNKFVAIVQKPVEFNAFDWNAGYFAEFIFGQDAAATQARGLSLGDNGDLEQAYVQVNAPLGNGLKVIFGKYVTPIGYELVENEQNPNWSGGLQWTFVEPFTHTGLQLNYPLSQEIEVDLYVNNGWDVVDDNNDSKSFIGRIAYTPNDNTSLTLIGYGGPEQTSIQKDPADGVPNADANWRRGVNFVLTHKCLPKLNTALQLDYGCETGADANGHLAEWWAIGTWMIYDLTEKVQPAVRIDYLNDKDGARTSDFVNFPANTHQELCSVTLTVNIKPVENLRLAPEIRYDHSSLDTAFDGHEDQVTIGFGGAFFY